MSFKRFRKYGRVSMRYKRPGVGAIATAVANRLNKSSTMTRTSSSNDTTNVLSENRDAKTDYRKRRLTRQRRRLQKTRRRWSRSVVNTVRKANVGTTHIVRRSAALLTTANDLSNSVCYGLYGLNGTANDTFNTTNDIGELFKEMDAASWANTNTFNTFGINHKIYAFSAAMECTLRNESATTAVIEAYFIRGKRPAFTTPYPSPTDVYANGFKRQQLATDPNTGAAFDGELNFQQVGVTPFQNTLFSRHYNIYKRQKYKIPPGEEISFVVTDPRARVFTMATARTYSTDRNYHGVLFQQQGVAALSDATPTYAKATGVSYVVQRRYRIKMMRDNLTKDAFEVTE